MLLDRAGKFALAMIVVGVGLLISAQFGIQPDSARAEAAQLESAAMYRGDLIHAGDSTIEPQQRFWATLPLRWEVSSFKEHMDAASSTFCSTVVSVRNLTVAAVTVEVEWYEWTSV